MPVANKTNKSLYTLKANPVYRSAISDPATSSSSRCIAISSRQAYTLMKRSVFIPSNLRSFFPRYRCLRRRGARVPEELLEDGLEEEGVVSVRNSISHTVAASIWELSQLTAPRALACSSAQHSARHRTVSQNGTLSGCLILGGKQLTVHNLIRGRICIVWEI